ncbi:MAG: cupin domain-containing protein [Haloferacaceae archaeon]
MERTRRRDEDEQEGIEPETEIEYEVPRIFVHQLASNYYSMKDKRQELRDENRVVKWDDTDWRELGEQVWNKDVFGSTTGGSHIFDKTDALQVHILEMAPEGESQNHVHQNEALMYILSGNGYEIHDGKRYEWEPGDLALIHGGCAHKHYSADPDNPARVLIIKNKPMYLFLHLIDQQYITKAPQEPAEGWEDYEPDEFGAPHRLDLEPAHRKVLEKVAELAPEQDEDPHSHHHEYMQKRADGGHDHEHGHDDDHSHGGEN